ncbi:hypothetical protein XcodCFBP4690_03715 [Xanthomonas codiaei]|uniref:Uncharacterized protein n=1 Tax=Xanthomonas codiaei TaxID=56463 RepID=A0A2S7CVH1_9XANT|nr:hypothetical protein XcodCFBP4690_03715 [Xanthomonas codiaei]
MGARPATVFRHALLAGLSARCEQTRQPIHDSWHFARSSLNAREHESSSEVPSPIGRRWRAAPDEGAGARGACGRSDASKHQPSATRSTHRTLTRTPAPRPGPRLRRGRSKAHAPMARKPCLFAPTGEGLSTRCGHPR